MYRATPARGYPMTPASPMPVRPQTLMPQTSPQQNFGLPCYPQSPMTLRSPQSRPQFVPQIGMQRPASSRGIPGFPYQRVSQPQLQGQAYNSNPHLNNIQQQVKPQQLNNGIQPLVLNKPQQQAYLKGQEESKQGQQTLQPNPQNQNQKLNESEMIKSLEKENQDLKQKLDKSEKECKKLKEQEEYLENKFRKLQERNKQQQEQGQKQEDGKEEEEEEEGAIY